MVYDKGIAREIEQRYGKKAKGDDGGEVLVAEVDNENPQHERGHKYTFATLALPYAKYDELGRRIKEKGRKNKKRSNDKTPNLSKQK